jgi:antitoxin component of MazEF toxin-antitoxin module
MRRKLEDKNIRKILKNGDSYAITLPIEMIRKLKWREKQKVEVELNGKKIVVKDWKK